ncbi:hypothetical protein [Haliangium ochraceum]|uniref:Leucine rich repeat variant n=1 Tax=Haliangium ochraceum (strain DSM 14365 / JCM 11303 / SMP-2) TaxID=502025 RepID=D0LYX4_HALO1|nr:hypothetical protein [Haliangium ochraceum]ACY14444.1 conserved hypothetical protein [Haliangium ochraceum DSM 14365]
MRSALGGWAHGLVYDNLSIARAMWQTLDKKLSALRDYRMRTGVLAEHLAAASPREVVVALAGFIERSVRRGDAAATLLLGCLAQTLGTEELVPYPLRRALYTSARQCEHPEVARLFFEALPAQSDAPAGDDMLAPERPLTPRGRPLTLGERKSLARSHRRELVVQLLRDPHPEVVAILLDNPHMTERDVLALASKRPSAAAALALVAANGRWAPRYAVRMALVQNPYLAVPWAVRLATTLRSRDLRTIAGDANLAPLVREQAAALGHL